MHESEENPSASNGELTEVEKENIEENVERKSSIRSDTVIKDQSGTENESAPVRYDNERQSSELPPLKINSDVENYGTDNELILEDETLIPTPPIINDRTSPLPAVPEIYDENSAEEPRIPIKIQEFSHIDFGLCVFAIILFLLDYAINLFIFQKFFHLEKDGKASYQIYFWMTFVFVALCSFITGVFEIVWYADEKKKYGHSLKWTQWIVRLFFICLLLGPAFRYLELIMFSYKHIHNAKDPKDKTKIVKKAMMMKEDADFLYMLEKFTESGLHLVLQMYIVKTELLKEEEKLIGTGEAMKIIIAVILMPYTVVCFLRSERQADDKAANMSNSGAIVQYFSRFFIISSQALVMSMFMSTYPFIFMILTITTWAVMAIWVFTQNTHFSQHSWLEAVYRFLIAFIYLFNYVNVRPDKSYFRALFYYCFMFIEKGLMVCFWTQQEPYENWDRWPILFTFFIFFIGGIFIKAMYYECHHPTRQRQKSYTKKIHSWVKSTKPRGPSRQISSQNNIP